MKRILLLLTVALVKAAMVTITRLEVVAGFDLLEESPALYRRLQHIPTRRGVALIAKARWLRELRRLTDQFRQGDSAHPHP